MAGLLDGIPPANNFGKLTPEQQAMLDRDKINESLGPFDWMPGPRTLGAVLGGAGAGAMIARDLAIPKWQAGGSLAALFGGGFYGKELKDRMFARDGREQQMMFGNPADAEGQPGGFYGIMPRK